MALKEELLVARKEIRTDDYSMSLGELTNLFRDGELRINPSFQRLFRWSIAQKSAFFESILVGIPIPPIFVYELENGHWELIDGLQRTSTILEFQGLLVDEEGNPFPASKLNETEYLPSLNNAVWDAALHEGDGNCHDIGSELRIDIKRSKIGVQILKKDSEERSKFDLFQRLNGNGSQLKPQEFRTCIMVMLNENKYEQCLTTAANENFRALNRFTENALRMQADLDYLCNFLALLDQDIDKSYDVDQFITHRIKDLFISDIGIEDKLRLLEDTSALIFENAGVDALKRFEDGEFVGRTGKVAYETIFIGVASNFQNVSSKPNVQEYLMEKIQELWASDFPATVLGAGLSGTSRISKTIPFGRNLFRD